MCEESSRELDTALVCPECGGRMVLVNGQATCLACGATPAPAADPPEHKEHHHHHHHAGHAHDEEAEAEPKDLTKLRILLPHWIEHNEDHAVSFERWVAKARELGREKTAQWIEEAVQQMAACNQALTTALESLEG